MAIVVPIVSKWDPSGVKQAQRDLDSIKDGLGSFGRKVAIGAAAAASGLVAFGASAIKAAEEAKVEDARLQNIATSMGLFGDQTETVVKRLQDFADATERATAVDGGLIKETQAQLLTFEELAKTAGTVGGSFDRATLAVLDMRAANVGGADAAIGLGKALQDPIKGITALARNGVTFTDAEKEMITALVEGGDILTAQDKILRVIERQVGGTAKATATASQRMKISWEQIKEAVGKALLPSFERLTTFVVEKLVPAFQDWWQRNGPQVEEVLRQIGDVAYTIATEYLPPLVGSVKDAVAGFKDWWDQSETVRPFLEWFADYCKDNPDKVRDFAAAVGLVVVGFKALSAFSTLATLIGGIGTASAGAAPGIAAAGSAAGISAGGFMALAGALGAAAGAWAYFKYLEKPEVQDMMESDLNRVKNEPWWKGFGAGISSAPAMGFGATGGIVSRPTLAMIGEAGPEAVVPLSSMPGASPLPGNLGAGVTINVSGAIDPVGVADQIARILNQRGYRNGRAA